MPGSFLLVRCLFSITVILGIVACSSSGREAAAPALHEDAIDQRNPGGKDLRITLREVRREAAVSEIVVAFSSGGSVASSLFIVKGMYAIAKLRGNAYFVKLREWEADDGTRHFLVGFTDDEHTAVKRQFPGLMDPGVEIEQWTVMSVKQYAPLFEKR